MADINIERKGPTLWLLLLGALVVAIAVWLGLRALNKGAAEMRDANCEMRDANCELESHPAAHISHLAFGISGSH